MNKSIQLLLGAGVFISMGSQSINAQVKGGITPDMMNQIRSSYHATPTNRALGNAIRNVSIQDIAKNSDGHIKLDNFFSDEVKSKGISILSFMINYTNLICSFKVSSIRVIRIWMIKWLNGFSNIL